MPVETRNAFIQLVVFLMCLYIITFRGIGIGDNLYHYAQVESIIQRGSLSLPVNGLLQTERDFSPFSAFGRDGHPYMTLPPGLALTSLPLGSIGFLAADIVGNQTSTILESGIRTDPLEAIRTIARTPQGMMTALINPILSALLAGIFFLFSLNLTGRFAHSLKMALIIGCCTIMWPYSSSYWTQPLCTLCLFTSLFLIHAGQGRDYLKTAGFLLGYGILTRYEVLIFLPVYLYYIHALRDSRLSESLRAMGAFLAGTAIPMLLLGLWNFYRFGSLLDTGAGHQRIPSFTWKGNLLVSIPSNLIGLNRSIFLYSPPLVLGAVGIRQLWQRNRKLAQTVLALSALAILIYGKFSFWFTPVSWGPRFLVILTPFLMLSAARMRITTERERILLRVLVPLGLLIQLTAVIIPFQLSAIDEYWGTVTLQGTSILKTELIPQFLSIFSSSTDFWWTGSTLTAIMAFLLFSGLFITGRRLIWFMYKYRGGDS